MKKFLSVILSLALVCSIFTFAPNMAVAEERAVLEIENKPLTVEYEGNVELKFTLSSAPLADAIGIENISFDTSKFELVSGVWSLPSGTVLKKNYDDHTGNGELAASAMYNAAKDLNGEIFTLTLAPRDITEAPHTSVSCSFSLKTDEGTQTIPSVVYGGSVNIHCFTAEKNVAAALKNAADCTLDADYYYSCTECDAFDTSDFYTAENTALGHNYTAEIAAAEYKRCDASCTAAAEYYKSCTRCEKSSEGDTNSIFTSGEPKGHSGGSATCSQKAECEECGEKYGSLNLSKHSPKASGNFAATCQKAGRTGKTVCQDCGKVVSAGRSVAKKAHTLKTETRDATLSRDGYIRKVCSACDEKISEKKIYKIKSVKLSKNEYAYNGKARTPSITVKDSKNKPLTKNSDYTVKLPSGRKNVGKYKVTITFKGDYSGSEELYFTITPPETKITKLSGAKKSLKVTWSKKTSQVTGYQLQYSTNKNFKSAKTATATSYKKTSTTIKKLSAKKTYYVRIRTYKTVGKTKYYSEWSARKSKKTK